jgi:hypothetical protein
MTLLVRTLTIAVLAAVVALPAAAAPPSVANARVKYGKPMISWTIRPARLPT